VPSTKTAKVRTENKQTNKQGQVKDKNLEKK
jgi:hypothetical protein